MDEKREVYEVVLDVWGIMKRFGFNALSESQWEELIVAGEGLRQKYKASGMDRERLYRDWFGAVQQYYQRKNEA